MKNIYQFVKNIKLKRILTVLFASSLLVMSTACSSNDVAKVKSEVISAGQDTYDKYDRQESYKGGMNGYNDDRRYDSETAAKTKALVDTAKRRQADSLSEVADNVKKVPNAAQDVLDNAQDAAEDAIKATKGAAKDIKDNVKDLT